jgi:RNA polymerase sigma-70 factor (ECF subfamily)
MGASSVRTLRRAAEQDARPLDRAEERRLLGAARDGDRSALNEVARRVSGSLYRFGRGFCRDPHDAEDVVQDVLAAMITSLRTFRGDSSLSTWAYVVARNACMRRRRHSGRVTALEPDGDGPAVEYVDPSAGPDRVAERRELREAMERAIAALPASQRDVLVLRDVEGLPGEVVAKQLGIALRAMKSRLHRARLALRDALAPFVAPDAPPPGPQCPDTARLLSRHLEGELDAAVCARLESHVENCPSCGATCATLREALGACRAWRSAPVPDDVREQVRAAIRSAVEGLRASGSIARPAGSLRAPAIGSGSTGRRTGAPRAPADKRPRKATPAGGGSTPTRADATRRSSRSTRRTSS